MPNDVDYQPPPTIEANTPITPSSIRASNAPAPEATNTHDFPASASADEFSEGGNALVQAWNTWRFLMRHAFLLSWTIFLIVGDYALLIFKLQLLEEDVPDERLSIIHRRNAIRYRTTAFRLKGGMIKIGQYISARVDVMPREWIQELSLLQDSVEPVSFDYIRATIKRELGEDPDVIFKHVDQEATAAASFGQVHRAVTHDGDELAIKVQHAHIERTLNIDLAIYRVGVRVFSALFPRFQIDRIYQEVSKALRRELRYDMEAEHCQRIHKNLADNPDITVPTVYPEYCSPQLIAMSFIHGKKINSREVMKEHNIDASTILRIVMDAFVKMIYVDGFFQSDPHPGNLFLIPGEGPQGVKVGLIDFGQVKEIPDHIHRSLRRSVWAVVMKDEELFLEMLIAMGIVQETDRKITAEVINEFAKYVEVGAPQEFNQIDYEEIAIIMQRFLSRIEQLYIPEDLILYGRTVGLLHGLATDLDPNINVFDIVRPHLMKFLFAG